MNTVLNTLENLIDEKVRDKKVETDVQDDVNGNTFSGDNTVTADQVAFRDIHNTNYYQSEAEFAVLSLQGDRYYLEPRFTYSLLSQLENFPLAVVYGGPAFDKERFIRHLAGRLRINGPEQVMELRENSESEGLLQSICRIDVPSILLLPRVHPRQIGYDADKLYQAARQKGHIIIITTDTPLDNWGFSPATVDQLWFQVPDGRIYQAEQLTNYLCLLLAEQRQQIPWIDNEEEITANYRLGQHTCADITRSLDRPEQVDLVVHMLSAFKSLPSPDRLDKILKQLTDSNEELIVKWFKALSMSQQLIVLAASMLEGMYDDQFFSVMRGAVRGFWEFRDPTLKCLDYCDLDFMLPFFEFEEIHEEKRLLRSRFPRQRTHLIRAAWATHRRHILHMLPRLIKLVMLTLERNTFDFERFGTIDRRMVLRQTVSHTISDLGLVSLPSVESALIELSATSDLRSSRVASKAMARWRELGEDELLFSTLNRWQDDADINALVLELVKSRRLGHFNQRDYDANAVEFIRASTVKVLGYAAEYDKPNELHPKIVDQLVRLAEDPYPRVHRAICEALPRFIHHHIFQLRSVLADHIMRIDGLDEPIAMGLKLAYDDHPSDLVRTIDHWLDLVKDDASKQNRRGKMTIRDKMLATILIFWTKIDYEDEHPDKYQRQKVVHILSALYQQEGREELRQRILEAALTLMSQDWRKSGKYVLNFFTPMQPNLDSLTSALYASFLEERKGMRGGDCIVKVGGHRVSAWYKAEKRPQTLVEQMLYHWLEKGEDDIKKLAALGLCVITYTFEMEERREVQLFFDYSQKEAALKSNNLSNQKAVKREFVSRPASSTSAYSLPPIYPDTDKYIRRIMKGRPQDMQRQVRMLYRYFLYKRTTDKELLGHLFTRWQERDNEDIKSIAFYLKKIMVDPRPAPTNWAGLIIGWTLAIMVFLFLLSTCL